MPSSCLQCNPCSGMLALFKRRPRAALLRRAVGRMNNNRRRRRRGAGSFSSVRAVFWPLMSMRSEADRNDVDVRPPTSSTDSGGGGALRSPSPSLDTSSTASTTAARVLSLQAQLGEAAASASTKPSSAGDRDSNDGVEDACRSFEKHLMEMLVEERKVKDLVDVEELLCCWEKLRSPVFVQLVGHFYGELCMDLFSGRETDLSSESEDFTI